MASTETTSLRVTLELRTLLAAVHAIGSTVGVDLTAPQMRGRDEPTRRPSDAAAIRYALAVVSGSTRAPNPDGVRLRRARLAAGLGQTGLARQLGYWHRASVSDVETGRRRLQGRLLAWVEEREGSR